MFKAFSLAALLLAGCAVQASAASDVGTVIASPAYKKAVSVLDSQHDRIVQDIVTLTEIPAPPFKEKARAEAYLEMLRAAGLTDVEMDAEGNVMGLRRGTGVRIRGGTARSYYVAVESSMPAIPGMEPPIQALCVAPFGMEEGSRRALRSHCKRRQSGGGDGLPAELPEPRSDLHRHLRAASDADDLRFPGQ